MELRTQNLTPLQRHLLTLLTKSRPTHAQPWLVLEPDCVCVEPVIQVLRGRAAIVAARGLRTMGWLRARPGGGLELTHASAAVAAALQCVKRREPSVAMDLEEVIERALSACLTLSSPSKLASVTQH